MMTYRSKNLVSARPLEESEGVILFIWGQGTELISAELNKREAIKICSEIMDKLIQSGDSRTIERFK